MSRLKTFSFFAAVFLSFDANAYSVTVIDQEGNAVPDAVVMVKGVATEKSPEVMVMDQVKKQFLPKVLVVQAGQSVSFPNSDDIQHHVYSFSQAKQFEIKLYHGQPSDPVVFEQPGVVVLGCNIHDNMIGYILVNGEGSAVKTDAAGIAVIKPDKAIKRLEIWHSRLAQGIDKPVIVSDMKQEDITVTLELTPKPTNTKKAFGNKFQRYGN
jgi:plastocyanin